MDAEALRALQQPLKEQYKTNPGTAVITLKANGDLEAEGVACKIDTGRALIEAGLHPSAGGTGLQACAGEMLLEALVACAGVTLKAVATATGFRLNGGSVSAEADLDVRGTLGIDKAAPVGFSNIRVTFTVDTDEPQDRIDMLTKLTERYCVVYQTLAKPPTIALAVKGSE